jgi:hypothetical protein
MKKIEQQVNTVSYETEDNCRRNIQFLSKFDNKTA